MFLDSSSKQQLLAPVTAYSIYSTKGSGGCRYYYEMKAFSQAFALPIKLGKTTNAYLSTCYVVSFPKDTLSNVLCSLKNTPKK